MLLAVQIKGEKPEYAIYLTLGVSIFLLFRLLSLLDGFLETMKSIYEGIHLKPTYFTLILRMVGISYVCSFASNICKDAGYGAIASQIEIFGKLSLLGLSMPIILALLETIESFLK